MEKVFPQTLVDIMFISLCGSQKMTKNEIAINTITIKLPCMTIMPLDYIKKKNIPIKLVMYLLNVRV